jgi:hypothetical protein
VQLILSYVSNGSSASGTSSVASSWAVQWTEVLNWVCDVRRTGEEDWGCAGPGRHKMQQGARVREVAAASNNQNHEPAAASATSSRGERLLEASLARVVSS